MSQASDKAYQQLKQQIQNGQLQPGDRLVERTICAQLKMSRTPVREALRMLTMEGLVTNRPNRGMVVSQLSEEEIEEIFEFGMVLEAYIASLAARKAPPEAISEMKAIVDEMSNLSLSKASDMRAYVELDRLLHIQIAAGAGNKMLAAMLSQAMNGRVLSQAFSRYSPEDCELSLQQHKVILRAIECGDSDWASSAMRTHILTGRTNSQAEELDSGPELAAVPSS